MWQGVGWAASAVLVCTVVYQVVRQWRTGHAEGVSQWLFIGQGTANAGFLAYGAHLGDRVFTVSNAVLLVAAAFGWWSVRRSRDVTPRAPPTPPPAPALDRHT